MRRTVFSVSRDTPCHPQRLSWLRLFKPSRSVDEVKGGVRTVRRAGYIAVALICTLYLLVNVAYVAAVPKEEIENSGQLIAAVFFTKVFGESVASKLLPLMIACSCAGNIVRHPFISSCGSSSRVILVTDTEFLADSSHVRPRSRPP